jgi:hypothetical protein
MPIEPPGVAPTPLTFHSAPQTPDVTAWTAWRDGAPATFADVFGAWRTAEGARVWSEALAGAPGAAWAFECPPLTTDGLDAAFEAVLVRSDGLEATPASFAAFREAFARSGGQEVGAFNNLGGDAWLIAPGPVGPPECYGHLARFVRGAPAGQIAALWRVVAEAVLARLDDRPLWLSTAGLGVPWLHVRIDGSPKYFRWQPYRGG